MCDSGPSQQSLHAIDQYKEEEIIYMPEIEIRPATAEDIKQLVKMDHSYSSNHVWQMDPQFAPDQTGAVFREVRLPRKAKVDYPRSPQSLA